MCHIKVNLNELDGHKKRADHLTELRIWLALFMGRQLKQDTNFQKA